MSLKIIFLLALCLQVCSIQAYMTFSRFQRTHNKTYQSKSELELREQIFNNNVAEIEEHNKKYQQGLETYQMGVNQFTDLSKEEFAGRFKIWTLNDTSMQNANTLDSTKLNAAVPTSIDWRDKGIVTAVKNQKLCGGCWAFSATGTLEGQLALKYGSLVSLSEQQLIDCDRSDNTGCNGGVVQYAINYVTKNGLSSEEEYPFKGYQRSCTTSGDIVVRSQGYVNIIQNDENDLKKAVGTIGPVSVAVNIEPLQSYKSGIFLGICSDDLDHGVLVVGYGTDNNTGLDYWIMKNSWGSDWGENGYYRLARGQGLCGIAKQACYPTGVTNGTIDGSETTTSNPHNSGTFRSQNTNVYVLGFLIITVASNVF